jgi:hypothetical protein
VAKVLEELQCHGGGGGEMVNIFVILYVPCVLNLTKMGTIGVLEDPCDVVEISSRGKYSQKQTAQLCNHYFSYYEYTRIILPIETHKETFPETFCCIQWSSLVCNLPPLPEDNTLNPFAILRNYQEIR